LRPYEQTLGDDSTHQNKQKMSRNNMPKTPRLAASRHFVFFTKELISQKLFKLQKPNLAQIFI
jgi:hypothetical protein